MGFFTSSIKLKLVVILVLILKFIKTLNFKIVIYMLIFNRLDHNKVCYDQIQMRPPGLVLTLRLQRSVSKTHSYLWAVTFWSVYVPQVSWYHSIIYTLSPSLVSLDHYSVLTEFVRLLRTNNIFPSSPILDPHTIQSSSETMFRSPSLVCYDRET